MCVNVFWAIQPATTAYHCSFYVAVHLHGRVVLNCKVRRSVNCKSVSTFLRRLLLSSSTRAETETDVGEEMIFSFALLALLQRLTLSTLKGYFTHSLLTTVWIQAPVIFFLIHVTVVEFRGRTEFHTLVDAFWWPQTPTGKKDHDAASNFALMLQSSDIFLFLT